MIPTLSQPSVIDQHMTPYVESEAGSKTSKAVGIMQTPESWQNLHRGTTRLSRHWGCGRPLRGFDKWPAGAQVM